MRKITKTLLILSLLLAGVGGTNSVKAEKFVSLGSVLTLAEAEAASTSGTGVAIVYNNSKLFANNTGDDPAMSLVDVSKATRGYMFKLSKRVVEAEVQYYRIQCYNPNSTLVAAGDAAGAYGNNILSPVSWGSVWASTIKSEEWDGRDDFEFGAQWCFESDGAGGYYIKTRANGSTKPYLSNSGDMTEEAGKASYKFYSLVEIVPYTLEWTPNAGTYRATIPLSESYIRTTGDVSINYSTGEVTNTGSGKLIIYLDNENLVGATGYNLTTTVEGEAGRLGASLDITDAVNGEVGGIYSSRNSWWIANDADRKDKIGAVKAFTYNFSGGNGSQTITSIYFDADLLVAQTTTKDLTSMPYGEWTAPASTLGTYISDDGGKTNNIGKGAQSLIYGHDGVGDVSKYVDLTNCSKIIFTGSSTDGGLRLFYNWDGTEDGKLTVNITDFPKTSGTYEFDIDAFKKSKGINFFHLFGIKSSAWNTTANISAIQVVEYTNVISGSGINKAKDYLLNPYITSIDATGVTAATALLAANPNCLITANAGKITNANNVIVSGTCANLVLEDNHPFKAPADFTATAASYTTTINASAKAGTLCLPFEATIPGGVEAWTLAYTSGDAAVATPVSTTIPANTPVLLNGSGEKTFTGSDAAVSASATNTYGALTGVFAATTVPVDSYVLQYQDPKVGFFKVTGAKTINPFRAYLTASGNAPSLSIIFPEDNDVTGISEIEKMKNAENVTIFDLQGRKVAQPQKGLYIVNGKKVIFK